MAAEPSHHDDDIFLSVVVPAFNESARIGPSLGELAGYLASRPFSSEIVVVDDGSIDGTAAVVRTTATGLPIRVLLLRYDENRGKGHALKVGFSAASGAHILFTDADLSTPVEETQRLLDALLGGADVAIASRKMDGARVALRQPWWRETMGKAFTYICRALITPVSDVTCGFKAYRGDVGRDIFARCRVSDWTFDAEALLIARIRDYEIAEVPVRWTDVAGSKVRLLPAVAGSLLGLARIRFHAAAGTYRARVDPVRVPDTWSSREMTAEVGERA